MLQQASQRGNSQAVREHRFNPNILLSTHLPTSFLATSQMQRPRLKRLADVNTTLYMPRPSPSGLLGLLSGWHTRIWHSVTYRTNMHLSYLSYLSAPGGHGLAPAREPACNYQLVPLEPSRSPFSRPSTWQVPMKD